MNKTKIEWTDFTWKIITGCKHGCPYCYVKRFTKDMTPQFHPDRLEQPLKLKKPSMIFVANTGDMWGSWVSQWQIEEVLSIIKRCPQHIFQFLTKNPKRYLRYDWSDLPNAWLGATVESQHHIHRMWEILVTKGAHVKFVSFEPLHGFIDSSIDDLDWVIIGAESIGRASNPKDVISTQRWAKPLIESVRKANIPLFLKPNLQWPEKIKEFPKIKEPQ